MATWIGLIVFTVIFLPVVILCWHELAAASGNAMGLPRWRHRFSRLPSSAVNSPI
jgi:hypothetical protein